jgi:hypothetical protein
MGIIQIEIVGSFTPHHSRQFSAMKGGHAQAVAEAIEFLSKEVLPRAIVQDHVLQAEGELPENRFGLLKPS